LGDKSSIMDLQLKGKTALVLAASKGLGKACAEALAAEGADVVIGARDPETLERTAASIRSAGKGRVLAVPVDVRIPADAETLLSAALSAFGRIDILVNNAAGNFLAKTETLSPRAFDAVIGIVLQGTINVTMACGKRWLAAKHPAVVLNIATTYAEIGSAYVVPSAVAKAGVLALTRAMAQAGTQLKWNAPVVVDKHCIGGIPGNRTSMILVPIVAAHGLPIPKTSSRAITSPAGTADTMEVLARVNVGAEEMQAIVAACNGCIVWGGHVNLSPADDILISVERPLSLDTREQMVASIMSKKLAAGSTHLLIDIPVGPTAKVTNGVESMRLRKLFEFVGDRFGIAVEVITTDGRQPIGNGIGPVLEAQDVMAVLANDPSAPTDLREKSLRLAGHLLEYDPKLRGGAGYARARDLLDSGAALKQMQKIIEAQGPSDCRKDLAGLAFDVKADRDGIVAAIDCLRLNRLARTAGAPIDKGAGIRLFKKIGDRVEQGEPLYRVFAVDQPELGLAAAATGAGTGYAIGPASPTGTATR